MFDFSEIKKFCSEIGFQPSKRKGQNFLVNEKVLDKIILAADLKPDDVILEIGPGFGILTAVLAEKVKKVVGVELDKKLTDFLRKKFAQQKNIEIIQADILDDKIISYFRLISPACGRQVFRSRYKLVANIPYNITGAVLRRFLSGCLLAKTNISVNQRQSASWPKPSLMVFMIQKEVAERIVDKYNKRSIISVIVNFYSQPRIFSYISKNNFWPRPKVDSAILRLELFPQNRYGLNTEQEINFLKIIKTGFRHPRKLLINNLAKFWPKEKALFALEKNKQPIHSRAEDITINTWYNIYRYLYEK